MKVSRYSPSRRSRVAMMSPDFGSIRTAEILRLPSSIFTFQTTWPARYPRVALSTLPFLAWVARAITWSLVKICWILVPSWASIMTTSSENPGAAIPRTHYS